MQSKFGLRLGFAQQVELDCVESAAIRLWAQSEALCCSGIVAVSSREVFDSPVATTATAGGGCPKPWSFCAWCWKLWYLSTWQPFLFGSAKVLFVCSPWFDTDEGKIRRGFQIS